MIPVMEPCKEEGAFVEPEVESARGLTAALVVARRIDGVNLICASRLYAAIAMIAANYGVAGYTII